MCPQLGKNLGKLDKWGTKEVAGLKYSESGFLRLKISSNRSHGVMNVNVKHLFLNINKAEEVSHPEKKNGGSSVTCEKKNMSCLFQLI